MGKRNEQGQAQRRAEVRRLIGEYDRSERRVCGLMEIPRMSYRYQSRRDDSDLRERLLELARDRRGGEERINHKRVWRVYRDLGLSVRRTRRKLLQRAMRLGSMAWRCARGIFWRGASSGRSTRFTFSRASRRRMLTSRAFMAGFAMR